MRIGILTVSDLGALGQRADTSGDAIVEWAGSHGYEVVVRSVVPDETDRIAGKLARWADSGEVDVILTTGGAAVPARLALPRGGGHAGQDPDRQSPRLDGRGGRRAGRAGRIAGSRRGPGDRRASVPLMSDV